MAIPTDTLYGLAADVFDTAAIDRVFAIKGRSENMALPVLVNGWEQAQTILKDAPSQARRLTDRFWPGGLTLVGRKAKAVPDRLTAGGPTVAVRMPDHQVPIALINGLGRPITGTSANISGGADISSLDELIALMGGLVGHIVRTGPAPAGTASTIVDITSGRPKLLREGAVAFESVLETWDQQAY